MKLAFIFLIALLGSSANSWADECPTFGTSQTLVGPPKYIWMRFDAASDSGFENTATVLPQILLEFQKKVSAKTKTDPIYLLKKQRDIYAALAVTGGALFSKEVSVENSVISHQLGQIDSMNCAEVTAFTLKLQIDPKLFEEPTEFEAYFLTGPRGESRVYFNSSPLPEVPTDPHLLAMVKADIKKGWILKRHLHNHPFFFFENATDDNDIAGTLVPSAGDRPTYCRDMTTLKLHEAWITNGFNSIRLEVNDFKTFSGP